MISVIIPFHNEKENLPLLQVRLHDIFREMGRKYELIFVNDGSTDDSAASLEKDSHTKLVQLRRQMGKGKALQEGFNESEGQIILFMDADLEDDPKEIPSFIAKIDDGYDLVNGVRQGRQHNSVIKSYSKFANSFIRSFLKSPFTDINCGFKAMKRQVLEEITLYGNNFRFMPLGAFYEGFKVTEIPVQHKHRMFGKSKFGVTKVFIGFFDTLTAYFLYRFAEKPLHFFGIWGAILSFFGFLILGYLGFERIVLGNEIYRRPILFLGLLLVIVGVQVGLTGLIAELIVFLHKRKK